MYTFVYILIEVELLAEVSMVWTLVQFNLDFFVAADYVKRQGRV